MLKIIERMRLFAVRKKKLAELEPRQRKFLLWARGISLLDFYENLKIRLHSMDYPPVYSCYTGIDWKTGKKLELPAVATAAAAAEPDALSELVAGGGTNPEPAVAAAVASGSEGTGGGGSVLASAGSSVLASQSSPRV